MNKLERVLNAINGRDVDRPPVCFWRHYGNIGPQATVDAHMKFFRESGMDMLKMMCDEFFTYPWDEHWTVDDLLKLKPLGRNSHYVRGQVERATQINEALKGEIFTLYNAFSPYATLKHTIGDAESMALIREHEEVALHVLDVICEDTCYLVEGILKESGTAGMMLPLQGAEHGRFTAEDYARLIAGTEKRVIECADAHSNTNLLHMCGWDGIPDHLEWWENYPARMLNWDVDVEKIDLAQGRKRFPDRVLLGGFDNREGTLLPAGKKEDIKVFAKRIVREAGKKELIVGANCSLPMDIDPERIRWVIEALEEMESED